ncbi:hypothetical protein [Niabella beijingensis]|uniref:hypothetical protein n=1 Tax=Niabella beijingensis TaxID=2872700 RepID=UPI001CBD093F|nr:hypothetical protein [Niabella beijingensis]MBZ4190445.1 hypothetical protein [Niabella beijingensis]
MANYSFDQLTTQADFDAILSIARKEQKDLEWKKLSIERQKDQYTENAVEIATELTAKQAELATLDSIIANLPDGELKEENIKKKKRTEYSIFLLTDRKANYGAVALLEKEYDLERVLRELEETTAFITAIGNNRPAEL